MMAIWQAVTVFFLSVAMVYAADSPKPFVWNPPKTTPSVFTAALGMLDAERDEYATNLATLAAKQVCAANASSPSLADARRLLALALHLSQHNKRALVVNFQLARGILPPDSAGGYSAQVFARLLLSRGQLLEKQTGDENTRLARIFIQLAANLDPKNEDAVYASEVIRIDHGSVDWSDLTDRSDSKP